MKTFSNKVLTAMLAALLTAMLAACGTGDGGVATDSGTDSSNAAPFGGVATSDNELVGEVNVWTWEAFENLVAVHEDFNEAFPYIDVVFTNVAAEDMPMRLQVTAAAGDMPQAVWIEINQRGRILSLDILETLSDPPYNANPDDFFDFMMPVHSTPDGRWVTVEVSTPISGLIYKRDLAERFIGTDDPDEIADLIQTWDDMFDLGLMIRQETNGEVYLFGSIQELEQILRGQRAVSFVQDGVLNIEDALGPVLDEVIRFYAAGLVAPANMWTPEWNASFNRSINLFNSGPTWYPTWVIEAQGTENEGNWGLTEAPRGGFLQGGTGVGIPSAAENKHLGWEYIRWMYLSREGAISNRDHMSYLTGYTPAWREEGFYSGANAFFGGQDLYRFFAERIAINMATTRPVSEFDIEVIDALDVALMAIKDANGQITSGELLDNMRSEIVNLVPDLR